MFNRRLIQMVPRAKKYVAAVVALQWLSLTANICFVFSLTEILGDALTGEIEESALLRMAAITVAAILVRFICTALGEKMSHLATVQVRQTLRSEIYGKLLRLGVAYREQVSTSEAVQLAAEGVEQLESYFGQYLPQFFYSLLAPLTLFAVLAPVSLKAATVLLVCVPLIPVSIALVQTAAKRIFSKYWDSYTGLGDTFLENLQGLTTLKLYQADAFQQEEMERQSEQFRKATMKVLVMQLNSVTVMDLIAYGGAALGVILSVSELWAGRILPENALAVILLAAEFFIPMRLLGSFFHISMNGAAAGEKIFRLLDLQEPKTGTQQIPPAPIGVSLTNTGFSYEEGRIALRGVSLEIPACSLVALVGESGCGKSTAAALMSGRLRGYTGSVRIGGAELSEIGEESLAQAVTLVTHDSYLFRGTVEENLRMGCPGASPEQLWQVLRRVNLEAFVKAGQGLDTVLTERGANLSGGQRQRLAIARALLHDSPVYIFDEATSNIDAESEAVILQVIRQLARTKAVLLISHRLANAAAADRIFVMSGGVLTQTGTHGQLFRENGLYADMYKRQQEMEGYLERGSYDAQTQGA